jgi:hypothetical protein
VAASPIQPVSGAAGWGGMGEQAGDLRDGQRDHAGVGWWRLAWPDRRWCLSIGAGPEQGGSDGQGGHHQLGVAGDRGVEADLGLIEPEAVLAQPELLFHGPAQPGCADQPGQGQRLALRDEAVVKGQLTCLEMTADQQAILRGGGNSKPRPGIPAGALGALPGGADLGVLAGGQLAGGVPQVNLRPPGRVRRKLDGTRST